MAWGTRHVSSVAVLAACATVVMMYVKFPIVPGAPFLKYDPSDAITLLAALWWGPATGVATVALKDLLLWLLRDGNPLGPLADAIAAGTFVACTAAVYRRLQPSGAQAGGGAAPGAGAGLGEAVTPAGAWRLALAVLAGTAARVAVMAVANFPILYLQFGMPAAKVAALLPTAIIPFNALKSLINGALATVMVVALARRRVLGPAWR